MSIRSDESIDSEIIRMRKLKFGLSRIHRWLSEWESFSMLDEIKSVEEIRQ